MDFYFLEGIYGYSNYCTEGKKIATLIGKSLGSASHISHILWSGLSQFSYWTT